MLSTTPTCARRARRDAHREIPSPLAQCWESLCPNRAYKVFLLLIVAFSGSAFWLAARVRHPDVPLDVMAMFRNGGGQSADAENYPIVTSYLEPGERLVYEARGTGVRVVPTASMLPHGLLFAALGIGGVVAADILVKLFYYASLSGLLKTLGVGRAVAEAFGVLVAANGFGWLESLSHTLVGNRWRLLLGDMRIGRPFVTDVFLFGALAFVVLPFLRNARAFQDSSWLALAILLAALLQGDVHSFFAVLLALGAQTVWLLAQARRDPGLWRSMVRGGGVFAGTFVLASVPFILQRLTELPDIPRRLGVFPVARTAPLVSAQGLPFFGIATTVAVVAVAVVYACSPGGAGHRIRSVVALWGMGVAAILALPLSCVALGKAAQTYHSGITVRALSSLLIVLCSAHLLESAAASLRVRFASSQARRWSDGLGRAFVAIACIYYTGVSAWSFAEASGGAGFIQLAQALRDREQRELKVMGTLDPTASIWWTSFGGGYAYVPDAAYTAISDAQLERRFASFCREIGMTRQQFGDEIVKWQTMASWLGTLKFQAFDGYSIAPPHDYSAADREWIRQNTAAGCWKLAMPARIARRLMRRYDEAQSPANANWRLDFIVLTKEGVMADLHPPSERYRVLYENDTYRVWETTQPSPPQKDERKFLHEARKIYRSP